MTASSAIFADCRTITDTNARYKELFPTATTKEALRDLMESHRLAMAARTTTDRPSPSPRPTTPNGTPEPRRRRVAAPSARAAMSDDGTQITCAGLCGETKSIRKFPTKSGAPGVREGVCRECREANRLARASR